MSDSDILAVRLFIASLAACCISVAMTQAGWTHRWFVRFMFALSAILAVLAVAWPKIGASVPPLDDVLGTLAASRIVWFVLGALLGAAIMLWMARALPITRHKRMINIPTISPNPGRIDICFKSGAPYEVSDIIDGRTHSTIAIGIRNSGDSVISNCRVYIEKLSPPSFRPGPIILGETGFSLRPLDPEKLIYIAVYWDHIGKYRFLEHVGGGIAEAIAWANAGVRCSLVIKVAATECARSAMFNIWLDENQKLRLKYVADAG